ncbi:putative transposase, partial [Phenoliferia sp. Uapishka_3]
GGNGGGSGDTKKADKVCTRCHKPGHLVNECHRTAYDEVEKAIKAGLLKRGDDGSITAAAAEIIPSASATIDNNPFQYAGADFIDAPIDVPAGTFQVDGLAGLIGAALSGKAEVPTVVPTPVDESTIALIASLKKLIALIDSGAGDHLFASAEGLVNIRTIPTTHIRIASGAILLATQAGDLITPDFSLQRVLIVPGLAFNLISVNRLANGRVKVEFDGGHCRAILKDSGRVVFDALLKNRSYLLEVCPSSTLTVDGAVTKALSLRELHNVAAHLNFRDCRLLAKSPLFEGWVVEDDNDKSPFCEHCVIGKHHQLPLKRSITTTANLFDIVSTDLAGPMQVESLNHKRYWISFIEHKSRRSFIYYLRDKSDALLAYQNFENMVETQLGLKIKVLRSDRGGEYINKLFGAHLGKRGTLLETRAPYKPQQNGIAEIFNRVLAERTVVVLDQSGLPRTFWAEISQYLVDVFALLPHATIGNKAPISLWPRNHGLTPDQLHPPGCAAYPLIPGELRKKLDPHARRCVFLGVDHGTKGYRLWDYENKRVVVSADVIFQHGAFPLRANAPPLKPPFDFNDLLIDDTPDEKAPKPVLPPPPPSPASQPSTIEELSRDFDDLDLDDDISAAGEDPAEPAPQVVVPPAFEDPNFQAHIPPPPPPVARSPSPEPEQRAPSPPPEALPPAEEDRRPSRNLPNVDYGLLHNPQARNRSERFAGVVTTQPLQTRGSVTLEDRSDYSRSSNSLFQTRNSLAGVPLSNTLSFENVGGGQNNIAPPIVSQAPVDCKTTNCPFSSDADKFRRPKGPRITSALSASTPPTLPRPARAQLQHNLRRSAIFAAQKANATAYVNAAIGRIVDDLAESGNSEQLEALLASPDVLKGMASLLEDSPTYRQAKASPEWRFWEVACAEEMASIDKTGTWTLVPRPTNGENIIRTQWVFRKKRGANGEITRYKARCVVLGNHQREGEDFDEVFASVGKATTLRILQALRAKLNLKCVQFDVSTAFLGADIDKDVYVYPPPGFEYPPGKENWVLKLNKSLYGLRQSPRLWRQRIDEVLKRIGFELSKADDGLYILNRGKRFAWLFLHVDDGKIFSNDDALIAEIKAGLEKEFDLTWDENPTYYLGIVESHDRKRGIVTLHQTPYLRQVLERFGMQNCHAEATPIAHGSLLEAGTVEQLEAGKHFPLAALVGALLYASSWTRPDISTAVSRISAFVSAPTPAAWEAGKRILRYIRGTLDYGLVYTRDLDPVQLQAQFSFIPNEWPRDREGNFLQVYSDADWAACVLTRRSVTGNLLMLANGPVDWLSRRQASVSPSTCAAEFQALAETGGQVTWSRFLLLELGFPQDSPTLLYGDNQGSIAVANSNASSHKKLRHVDIKSFLIKEMVEKGTIEISYISTKDMMADCMTKGLPREAHQRAVAAMGLRPIGSRGGV